MKNNRMQLNCNDLLRPVIYSQGLNTPFLSVENMEVGEYTFTLVVTDASRQTTTGFIKVTVKEGIPQLVPFNHLSYIEV